MKRTKMDELILNIKEELVNNGVNILGDFVMEDSVYEFQFETRKPLLGGKGYHSRVKSPYCEGLGQYAGEKDLVRILLNIKEGKGSEEEKENGIIYTMIKYLLRDDYLRVRDIRGSEFRKFEEIIREFTDYKITVPIETCGVWLNSAKYFWPFKRSDVHESLLFDDIAMRKNKNYFMAITETMINAINTHEIFYSVGRPN